MLMYRGISTNVDTKTNFIERSSTGYYTETLITNHSSQYIYIIDSSGIQQKLPPGIRHINYPDTGVLIQKRISTDTSHYNQLGYDDSGTCSKLFIEESEFEKRYYYIKDLNVVITTKNHVDEVQHPYQVIDYQAKIKDVLEKSFNTCYNPVYTIVVNDPYHRTDNLYIIVNNSLCRVKVTHYEDQAVFCDIHYIAESNPNFPQVIHLNYEEILKGRGVIKYNDDVYFIGSNSSLVRSVYNQYKQNEHDKISSEEYDKQLKEIQSKHKKDLIEQETQHESEKSRFKSNYEIKLNHYELQIQKLDSEIFTLKSQNQELSNMINSYKGNLGYQTDVSKHNYELEKAKYSYKKEEVGLWSTIGKCALVIIPVLIGVIFKIKTS
jgi:hypothetical protein